jgi:hypothetical protein
MMAFIGASWTIVTLNLFYTLLNNPSDANDYHSGPDSVPFLACSELESVHKGAPTRDAQASDVGGTFWDAVVGGLYSGNGPEMDLNMSRIDNYSQRKDY